MEKNVLEFLENSQRMYGEKTACSDMNNELTYTQLMNQAKFIGSCLSLKIKPTHGVPVYMDKTCNTLSLFMGIVYAGGYYCMLDTTHPAERINLILDTIQADILVVDNKSAKKAEKLGFQGEIINLDELLEGYDGQAVDALAQERLDKIREQALDIDPLYSIFTSGSTGVPKGVIVNHRSTIDFIDCFTETFGITNEDVIGNQAPFDFDVSVKDIYSSLKTGATLQLIPKMCFSFPTKLLDFLADGGSLNSFDFDEEGWEECFVGRWWIKNEDLYYVLATMMGDISGGNGLYQLPELTTTLMHTKMTSSNATTNLKDIRDEYRGNGLISTASDIVGWGSAIAGVAGNVTCNELYWIGKNGKIYTANQRLKGAKGSYVYNRSYELAKGRTALLRNIAKKCTYISIGMDLIALYNNPCPDVWMNLGIDISSALIPGVGWMVSIVYSGANEYVIYKTGSGIGQHIYDFIK